MGSLVTSGSKLGLSLDQNVDSQFWCMKSDGRIYSKLKPNLVLDIKGTIVSLPVRCFSPVTVGLNLEAHVDMESAGH